MSIWFMTAAVLPDITVEAALGPDRQALLSSAVQAGFVVGALLISLTGLADRLDPRRVFAACALSAAAANAALLVLPVGSDAAVLMRFLTGALLAGVYPVGMKLAVGWGAADRGLLVGTLVGALTLGKSAPYLFAYIGGAEWRWALGGVSALAALGGLVVLMTELGPGHARATAFRISAIRLAWTDRRIRAAYLGYFSHMWELFVVWASIGAAAAASYAASMSLHDAESLGKLTAFLGIALGAPFCVLAGYYADRLGKAEIAMTALVASGALALVTALTFGGPVWITFVLMIAWGMAVVPDSAQFSALVADFAPPEISGSLLTFQTALGFTVTIVTVQAVPWAVSGFGWPAVLAALALGPAAGILAMLPLRRGRAPAPV
ncbi:MAG TPA: MFS transporter [Devosiaceae bacterium]|nr:MFS transporter [Devosiaceae bacterium]